MLLALFAAQILLTQLAVHNPVWIEHYYTRGVYTVLSRVLRSFCDLLPFSLAEVLLLLAVVAIARLLWRWFKDLSLLGDSAAVPSWLARCLWQATCLALVVQLAFLLVWGLNYYRPPLAFTLGLDARPAEVAELRVLVDELIDQANYERTLTFENSEGIADLKNETATYLWRLWDESSQHRQAKAVFLSPMMSYTQITGFFFPFTGEANINTNVPRYELPATIAHELAHQDGVAREDEANFVSWQKSRLPGLTPEIRYSGTMLALVHTLNACASVMTAEDYSALWQRISTAVDRDLAYSRRFWEQYRGPVQVMAEQVNDTYLKSNRQSDGVRSYGRMVDLLLAERRTATP